MSWDAVGAIGEVLGAIAVFVTLAYLALQIRQTRTDLRRSIRQARGEALRQILLAEMGNERLLAARKSANAALGGSSGGFTRELEVRAGLCREDAQVVANFEIANWSYRLQIIPEIAELSPSERRAFENHIAASYGYTPVGRLFYETFVKPGGFPKETIEYLESVISRRAEEDD